MTPFVDQPHWQSFELMYLVASFSAMWQGGPAEGLRLLQLRQTVWLCCSTQHLKQHFGVWLLEQQTVVRSM